MKAPSVSEIKKELLNKDYQDLLSLCMRLAKYKKENKELLSYLLFDSENEGAYISKIKLEIDEQFSQINKSNLYWAKKSLRKILRNTNKFIKYSGVKTTEIELLVYYLNKLKDSQIPYRSSITLQNLYEQQLKKIDKAMETLHEDLRFDYKSHVSKLRN